MPQRKRAVGFVFDRARPIGDLDIDWLDAQAMPLCIFHQHRRTVKAHRLVVQNRACKCCEVFHLEISRGIRDQRKAGGMRFRKTVERKRADVLNDRVLRRRIDVLWQSCRREASPSRFFIRSQERRIPTARRSSSASAPEKLATVMAMRKQLFLKERHAQRALQHRFQRRMRIGHLFFLLAASHIGCIILPTMGPGRIIATCTTRS